MPAYEFFGSRVDFTAVYIQLAFSAVKGDTVFTALQMHGNPASVFEVDIDIKERSVPWTEGIPLPHTTDHDWPRIVGAQSRLCCIQKMGNPVGDLTSWNLRNKSEVVVNPLGMIIHPRSRPEPNVVIEFGWNRLGFPGFGAPGPGLDHNFDMLHVTDQSVADDLRCDYKTLIRSLLAAHLDNLFVGFRKLDQLPAFFNM